ncbi:MAG: hypothetical protein K0B02_01525 [DPANN group archaeon]|nr:hypothetical protein [DPANN group archaeon]
MDKVGEVRNALLKTLDIDKVYLIYMDETKKVHWHQDAYLLLGYCR